MEPIFRLVQLETGIVELIMDLPQEKVNKLTTSVMAELESVLNKIHADQSIRALLFSSAKEGVFIAGADIAEIDSISSSELGFQKARSGQRILDKLEALPFPTIAVINGACLGGGLELALACRYRVATDHPKTKIGLIEVSLGIIPGFGGTQRLPRLIGLERSLPLILGAKKLDGNQALKKGIVDSVFAHEVIHQKALAFAKNVMNSDDKFIRARRRPKGFISWILDRTLLGRFLVYQMAKKDVLAQSDGHYPAPLSALEVIKQTYGGPVEKGMEKEAHAFSQLVITDICRHLIALYYTDEVLKKDPGVVASSLPKKIRYTGVLGAGVMGGGIAWLMSNNDLSTRMKDVSWDAIAKGYESAMTIYKQLTKRRRLERREANLKLHHISATTDYRGFSRSDIVVEAIIEDIEIKKKVLAELEKEVGADAIIASNTSALSITQMASVLTHPERFVVMHFFNPVNRMPLVEVIPGKQTSPETVASTVAFAKSLKKTAIVVQDCPGFLVNRILLPYMNEALLMLEEGADLEEIDEVVLRFGMPMGPMTLADEVGIDVCYKVAKILEGGYGPRMKVAQSIQLIYEQKWLGKKSKMGFYDYSGKERKLNPHIVEKVMGIGRSNSTALTDETMVERCLLIMINEASRCLEEGIVTRPDYLDMAMIMGTGFPPFRGGLLSYADHLGIAYVKDALLRYADHLGERFAPSDLLTQMAREKKTFRGGQS